MLATSKDCMDFQKFFILYIVLSTYIYANLAILFGNKNMYNHTLQRKTTSAKYYG